MLIQGFQPFSLIDYPGKMSCIVFTGNCNFRCPYCHNPSLVFDPDSQPGLPLEQFWEFLERRQGRLDGVVISGGEPTLHHELTEFIAKIKGLGFEVKLDTNGTNPAALKNIYELCGLDYLAIDYKAPITKYPSAVFTTPEIAAKVQESIRYAVKHGIPMEIRTTIHRSLLTPEDIMQMRLELDQLGVDLWYLQQFNTTVVDLIDETLAQQPTYSDQELVLMAERAGGNNFARGLKGSLLKHRNAVRGESQDQTQS